MHSVISYMRRVAQVVVLASTRAWQWYRAQKRFIQIGVALIVLAAILGIALMLNTSPKAGANDQLRTVTLKSVGELAGGTSGVGIIGTVRSVAQADILAQSGGTVKTLNAALGTRVPAGFAIATLENASQQAAVLQAEGAYDAAVAARSAVSPEDSAATARTTYRSAFSALEGTLETDVDLFFGDRTTYGPQLRLSGSGSEGDVLSRERQALTDIMRTWRTSLTTIDTRDPLALLTEAETTLARTATFLDRLARTANKTGSNVTTAQLAGLATARTTVNAQLAAVGSARTSYRANSTTSSASADANVKSALGALRAAQAALEKTVVRAPIAGTVNFLPIRTGDYVSAYQHVATVAENGALEIVTYASENDRQLITVGTTVMIEDTHPGIVTSIAPALDPSTKQIEVRIALKDAGAIVNGQTVRITLPGATVSETETEGPVMLPLSSVKLRGNDRFVFSVGEDGRLVAHTVEIGAVRGDHIEITSDLSTALRIAVDARGLAEGERVAIAPE